MKSMKFLYSVILLLVGFTSSAQTPEVWQNFLDAKANGTKPTLLDFSYAGYKFSETPIPDVSNWAKFDVTDYGAVADDEGYDDDAIQSTIDAAEASDAPAVVYFPAGRFIVSADNDASKFIKIRRSNIVLKGSGNAEGGTQIFMDKVRAVNGHWQFEFAPESPNLSTITQITDAVSRGDFNINVVDASGLSEGQAVYISHKSEEFARAHFGDLQLSSNWSRLFGSGGGMTVYEPHLIESITGNQVTFANPIQTDLPVLSTSYNIKNLETISEVGIEDILFTSNWEIYGETFVHHKDDIHDYGWSAVQFEYAQNAWMRNCNFIGWSEVVDVRQSIGVTIENVNISGEKGHASFLTRRSYGVLVKDCVDESGQHHGPGTGYSGVNTVYLRCSMQENQSLDAHSGQPYATLMDDVKGGVFDRNGGPYESYPHHARDFVFWNFRHVASGSKNYNFWLVNSRNGNTYADPYFIGFQSNHTVNFQNEGLNEMAGSMVEPRSLFEAQLALRLEKDASLPSVSFISPKAGANISRGSSITVEVTATDPDGTIVNVDLKLGEQALRRIETAPYEWGANASEDPLLSNLTAGQYTLIATATDNEDNSKSEEISFTVGTAPSVSFIKPQSTQIIEEGQHVEVEVTATDSDGTINRISLYINAQLVGTKNQSPYSWGLSANEDPLLFNLTPGEHVLEAVVFDDDDLSALATQSFVVNKPPSLVFSTPEDGSTFDEGGNVKINVGASDEDGSVVDVKLYINENFLRADNSVPYTWGFDDAKDPELFDMNAGQYWIRAEARDNRGSKVSDSILVIIQSNILLGSSPDKLSIYPNPFIDRINIQHSFQEIQHLRLTDINGKQMKIRIENKKNVIIVTPTENLTFGIYLVHYEDSKGNHTMKVLKR